MLASAWASLPVEPSGPGEPILRFCDARMFVSRSTSASIQSFISSSLVDASLRSSGRFFQSFTAWAIGPRALGHDGAADRHPLVHERGQGDPPAVARRAEALAVGDADVGEVHLVELGLAGHLAQRPHLDARAPPCRRR